MAKQKPIEVITPPNVLKTKIGGALPAIDQQAIARAEAALQRLSSRFEDWVNEELSKLLAAWSAFEAAPSDPKSKNNLHRAAHDLKGLAPTYGYPLVGRMCATLCKLTGDEHGDLKPPASLLKAHVDGVKVAVHRKITGSENPTGLALANELEQQTKALIAQQKEPLPPPKA
jgi:chemotaxis protein histidine kinase CheA